VSAAPFQPIIEPQPGAYLTESQAQRCECLRLAFELCAGRSIHIGTISAIARWLYANEVSDT
jgi:hypothetical protein